MADQLGDRIRDARERKGMTQQELADAVGVARETVGNWELGETSPRNKMGLLREVLDDRLDGSVPMDRHYLGVLLKIDPGVWEHMDPIDRARAESEATSAYLRIAQEARRRADEA